MSNDNELYYMLYFIYIIFYELYFYVYYRCKSACFLRGLQVERMIDLNDK